MVGANLELGGQGGGVVFLSLPAFLRSLISSTQNKGDRALRGTPLDPPPLT